MTVPHVSLAVYALTPEGATLGLGIAEALQCELFLSEHIPLPAIYEANVQQQGEQGKRPSIQRFSALKACVQNNFSCYSGHIFVAATGIVVRCIAPLLHDKTQDPAVVVLDQAGKFVVSLLSGHLGGANALSQHIAQLLGAQAVITTATDTAGLPSLDMLAQQHGLHIANIGAVKTINAALLRGDVVHVYDPNNLLHLHTLTAGTFHALHTIPQCGSRGIMPLVGVRGATPPCQPEALHISPTPAVWVSPRIFPDLSEQILLLHPRSIHIGIGCRKGAKAEHILRLVKRLLTEHGLAEASVAALASSVIKEHEPGLREAAATLGVPLRCYDAAALNSKPVSSISPKALEILGVQGVCEPAALCSASEQGREVYLLNPKASENGVTAAIAQEGI